MPSEPRDIAVEALLAAHHSGTPLAALPDGTSPPDIATAHAIQDRLVERLGEAVAGWKVSASNGLTRGAILASRMHTSPAVLPAAGLAPFGIEGEIAFELMRDLPTREQPYALAEVLDAVRPLAAIEIVSARFASYTQTPLLDRLCDCMSNGALICAVPRDDWRSLDFATLRVRLTRDGETAYDADGGHPGGNPLDWLLAHVNQFRATTGLARGLIVTCGTYTGLIFGAPGDHWRVAFDGFAPVELTIAPSPANPAGDPAASPAA